MRRGIKILKNSPRPAWANSQMGNPRSNASSMNAEFDVSALHEALDRQRRARGLNWSQLGRTLGGISPSTLQGMRKRRAVEGDGVPQVLRWLGCIPENFLRGRVDPMRPAAPLPAVPAFAGLRFDARAIYHALEARRLERGMTWRQVGEAVSMAASSLTRLRRGGRVGF